MYHRTNQFHKALKCFSNVLEKLPEDKTVYIARGLVYQDMGNHQFAVNDFNSAINLDPNFAEAYYRRGVSKLKSRRYHEAIEDFRKSLELDT
jgi:tetratricopeptide (TPR) repeat protein